MTRYISIERDVIKQNSLDGGHRPAIVIEEQGQSPYWVREVEILGPSKVVYHPDDPDTDDRLSTAWIETDANLRITPA